MSILFTVVVQNDTRCRCCSRSLSSVFSDTGGRGRSSLLRDMLISSFLVLLKATFHLVARVLILLSQSLVFQHVFHHYQGASILVSSANNFMTDSLSFTMLFTEIRQKDMS